MLQLKNGTDFVSHSACNSNPLVFSFIYTPTPSLLWLLLSLQVYPSKSIHKHWLDSHPYR